jgi:hypothetical protein
MFTIKDALTTIHLFLDGKKTGTGPDLKKRDLRDKWRKAYVYKRTYPCSIYLLEIELGTQIFRKFWGTSRMLFGTASFTQSKISCRALGVNLSKN